jgi:hypothetical protein
VKALLKTLFGDLRNCCVVGALIAAETALIREGFTELAPLVLPPLTLAGVFWLAWTWRADPHASARE